MEETHGQKKNIPIEAYTFPRKDQMTWMNDDGSLAASNLKQWFSSIFGVENLYALEKEVDFKTLQEISAWLMEQYGLGADVVQDQELPTDEDDADSPK